MSNIYKDLQILHYLLAEFYFNLQKINANYQQYIANI